MEKIANRVSLISIVINIFLSVFKFAAGIFAHSGAMISDSIHSASDVFSTIIVMIGIHLSSKESDKEHPYGHERLECVAAVVLAAILLVTGLEIGFQAFQNMLHHSYGTMQTPGILALIAAVISILTKEAMFWYTKINAERIDSNALLADAWHHRSDALSSIGALIGISGARMGFPVMDSIASLVICFFIAKAAYDIFSDSIMKMVDHSCDESIEKELLTCISSEPGVLRVDLFRTRIFGNKIYVDLEISADADISLRSAHAIAERVHNKIESSFPKIKHIMIHINPLE